MNKAHDRRGRFASGRGGSFAPTGGSIPTSQHGSGALRGSHGSVPTMGGRPAKPVANPNRVKVDGHPGRAVSLRTVPTASGAAGAKGHTTLGDGNHVPFPPTQIPPGSTKRFPSRASALPGRKQADKVAVQSALRMAKGRMANKSYNSMTRTEKIAAYIKMYGRPPSGKMLARLK